MKEYGKYALGGEADRLVSAVVPGVMGQTGMETVEIVRGIVEETEPDFVIAIDALAARSVRRLNRTIQLQIPESRRAPALEITETRSQRRRWGFR